MMKISVDIFCHIVYKCLKKNKTENYWRYDLFILKTSFIENKLQYAGSHMFTKLYFSVAIYD